MSAPLVIDHLYTTLPTRESKIKTKEENYGILVRIEKRSSKAQPKPKGRQQAKTPNHFVVVANTDIKS